LPRPFFSRGYLGLLVFLHTTVGETAAFNRRGFREKFVRSIPTAPTSLLIFFQGLAKPARQQKAADLRGGGIVCRLGAPIPMQAPTFLLFGFALFSVAAGPRAGQGQMQPELDVLASKIADQVAKSRSKTTIVVGFMGPAGKPTPSHGRRRGSGDRGGKHLLIWRSRLGSSETTGIRKGRHYKLQAKITSEALLADLNYIQTIEFMDHPSPRFWGITFPPEDWNPTERKRSQPRPS